MKNSNFAGFEVCLLSFLPCVSSLAQPPEPSGVVEPSASPTTEPTSKPTARTTTKQSSAPMTPSEASTSTPPSASATTASTTTWTPQVLIHINDTDGTTTAINDDIVKLSESVPCTAELSTPNPSGNPVNIVLNNTDGRLDIAGQNSQGYLYLTLPADPTITDPVPFSLIGAVTSSTANNAEIKAHVGNVYTAIIGRKSLTVWKFANAYADVIAGGSYVTTMLADGSIAYYSTPIDPSTGESIAPAVTLVSGIAVVPNSIDFSAPQLARYEVGLTQNIYYDKSRVVIDDPYIVEWGSAVPSGYSFTVPSNFERNDLLNAQTQDVIFYSGGPSPTTADPLYDNQYDSIATLADTTSGALATSYDLPALPATIYFDQRDMYNNVVATFKYRGFRFFRNSTFRVWGVLRDMTIPRPTGVSTIEPFKQHQWTMALDSNDPNSKAKTNYAMSNPIDSPITGIPFANSQFNWQETYQGYITFTK